MVNKHDKFWGVFPVPVVLTFLSHLTFALAHLLQAIAVRVPESDITGKLIVGMLRPRTIIPRASLSNAALGL